MYCTTGETFCIRKWIGGNMVWVVLLNYWLGVTILGNFEQKCNTHLQWDRACLSDGKSYIGDMAMSAAVF